jgi:YcxB-like protein
MSVRYTLSLQDHLAWYDYYLATPEGARFRSPLPLIGKISDRFRRRKFSRKVALPPSRHAFGERTLEITEQGVREFSPEFSFTTAWSDFSFVAVTSSHLFFAHSSMNAHIVPLHYFQNNAERESFISFAQSHVRTNAAEQITKPKASLLNGS